MTDFWGFLLQTLTVSGAAAMLLVVKRLFQDKLPPRWQFSIWGLLGMVMLLPAGIGGRYALVNWPFAVELLKEMAGGAYVPTQVTAPIPLPQWKQPVSLWDWVFLLYVAGIAVLLVRDMIAYGKLRMALRQGKPVEGQQAKRIAQTAEAYGLPSCRAVEMEGISSAFVCGLVRPVLVLPAGGWTDEKVLLHELLHVRHHDIVWGILIHLFRCLHWCNPFLRYCAGRAANDLEALCDQRVLERLEGEERRDYGRILLSMTNEKYASMPGTSSVANGGRGIRTRIEAIARFKRYPAGMALAAVCVAVVLALPLLTGAKAADIRIYHNPRFSLASARATPCSTMAGALDTYGKAVLSKNGIYRIACAPMSEQAELEEQLAVVSDVHFWNGGLEQFPLTQYGYHLYHLLPAGEDVWTCLVVVTVEENQAPELPPVTLAVQNVLTYQEHGRWVVQPMEPFRFVQTDAGTHEWGCAELPVIVYEAETARFRVSVNYQQMMEVDNQIVSRGASPWMGTYCAQFDGNPKPHAKFDQYRYMESIRVEYLGDEAGKSQLETLGLATEHWERGTERPVLDYEEEWESFSSTVGAQHASCHIQEDWDGIWMPGSGGSSGRPEEAELPDAIAADLYVNGALEAQLTLTRKGMAEHG